MTNADGSVDVYIGPESPEGRESTWIRTLPQTGWFPIGASMTPNRHGSTSAGNQAT
jgi:hypothetical protein